jgi:DNA-binding IclR family transcriptional regulator
VSVHSNIGRRLELLAALLDNEAATGRGLGVVAMAARVRREKSQISRGFAALVREDLADRDAQTLEFAVGPAMLALAARAGAPKLLAVAHPVVESLAAAVGERVDLVVLHERQVLAVDSIASSSTVQSVGWTGRRTPLYCTAAGRVLLAPFSDAEISALIGPEPLSVAGPNAPVTLGDLLARVAATRRDGFAVAERELDPDVTAVAAPVCDHDGAVLAAVTVAGPAFRVEQHVDELVAAVLDAAAEVSAGLDP